MEKTLQTYEKKCKFDGTIQKNKCYAKFCNIKNKQCSSCYSNGSPRYAHTIEQRLGVEK